MFGAISLLSKHKANWSWFSFFIELRTCHHRLANNIVELAISQVSSMRDWQLDLCSIVDLLVTMIALVIWHSCKISFDKIVVDFFN